MPLLDESPQVHALLPLLYVAWADGILTPSEIEQLCDAIEEIDWIDAEEKARLQRHLDPQAPPSATTYFHWIRVLRTGAAAAELSYRCSLAELGAAMAQAAGQDLSEPARRALTDIEQALHVDGAEVLCDLLGTRPAPPEPDPHAEAPFPVARLQAVLDAPHADLRQRILTLLQDPAFALDASQPTAAYREDVLQACQLLADQGIGALGYPPACGGAGDLGRFMVAFETLAYHDLSLVIKFGVQFGLFGGSIQHLGSERHHEQYLGRAGTLDLPGCFAMSELGHGSNVRELETTAHYDPSAETFTIHTPRDAARKEWIGNAAAHGRMATVFAQLHTQGEGYGVHAFLVPIRDADGTPRPGIRIEDCGEKMGLNGVDNGRIWFDHVEIPRENLLDRFATVAPDGAYDSPIPSAGKRFFTMLSTLVGGRISVARAGVSAAKSALTIAIRYGNRRRQFGPKDKPEVPLLDYQTHQRRLLPALATTYGLHFTLQDLAQRFAATSVEQGLDDIEAEANALKAYATWHTTATIQTAREACGGQGYLAENRFAALKADTDVFTTFEGDNTVLLLQVAKGLLSDFRREFRDMNVFATARFIADEIATRVAEMNPIATRKTGSEHLRSIDFQRRAFRFRAESMLQTVGRRLKRRIDGGMTPFDAFVSVQAQLVALAQAHAERLVLTGLHDAIGAVEEGALRDVLRPLRSLYALARIEAGLDWYLEAGYVEASKSKAIRREVDALCAELRPAAEGLVDAFGIPDAILGARLRRAPSRALTARTARRRRCLGCASRAPRGRGAAWSGRRRQRACRF